MDKFKVAWREVYGFECDFDGRVAKRDFLIFVAEELSSLIQAGAYRMECREGVWHAIGDGNCEPIIGLQFDATGLHTGVKVMVASFAPVNAHGFSANRPINVHHWMLVEDDDSVESLWKYLGGDVRDNLNSTLAANEIPDVTFLDTDGQRHVVSIKVRFLLIPDLAFAHSALGLAGCNCSYPCTKCEIHQRNLTSVNLEVQRGARPRTRARIKELAHVVEGLCPGCGMRIVKTVTDRENEMLILKQGIGGSERVTPQMLRKLDLRIAKAQQEFMAATARGERPIPPEEAGRSWIAIHFGVLPGYGCFFDAIDVPQVIQDILHTGVRTGNASASLGLWKELARVLRTRDARLVSGDDDGGATSFRVFEFMKQKSFRIKKLVAPAKVEILGVYHHSIVTCQMLGPDVNLLLAQTE